MKKFFNSTINIIKTIFGFLFDVLYFFEGIFLVYSPAVAIVHLFKDENLAFLVIIIYAIVFCCGLLRGQKKEEKIERETAERKAIEKTETIKKEIESFKNTINDTNLFENLSQVERDTICEIFENKIYNL
jgi:hypothetical protein